MSKIADFIDGLSEEEIEMFEKDMKEGYMQKYLDRKKSFFKVKDKICPVCGNMVEPDCFVLIWGELSVRKKAHFCGKDCLQYFLSQSPSLKGKTINQEKNTQEKDAEKRVDKYQQKVSKENASKRIKKDV